MIVDLLEAKLLVPGFVGRARLAAALQHHFTERGMPHPLDAGRSIVAQPGPPARRTGSTEGNYVLQVLHHHCTSVLVFKWLHMLHVSSSGVNGHRAFLTPVQDLAIHVSFPTPLLFRTVISTAQALAKKGLRWLEQITYCCLGL